MSVENVESGNRRGPALEDADERFDAVVVGAGVAGAALAASLARAIRASRAIRESREIPESQANTRSVLLLERQPFPREKTCGGCLHREGLAVLDRLGLAHAVPADAPVVCAATVWAGGRPTRVPSRHGRVVNRAPFDAALVAQAIASGAVFRDGVTARAIEPLNGNGNGIANTADETFPWSIDTGTHRIRARVVAAADGLGGSSLKRVPGFELARTPASRIGLGATASPGPDAALPPGEVAMLVSAHGYLGLTRLGPKPDAPVDLAAAADPGFVREAGGPGPAAAKLAEAAGAPAAFARWAREAPRWRATPPLTCRRGRLAAPGLRVLGDAGGYLEPFTGEGMAWALQDAEAAAEALHRVLLDGGETPLRAAAWEARQRRRIAARQRRCRAVAAVLRRPALTRPVLAGASLAAPLLQRRRAAS